MLDLKVGSKKWGCLGGLVSTLSLAGFSRRYKLTIGDKSVTGAIWLLPGMVDNTVGVALAMAVVWAEWACRRV